MAAAVMVRLAASRACDCADSLSDAHPPGWIDPQIATLIEQTAPENPRFSAAAPSHSRSRRAGEKSWNVVTAMSRPFGLDA
jgi:hypothetical protein